MLWIDANLLVRLMRDPRTPLSLFDAKGRRTLQYAPSDLLRLRDIASTHAHELSDVFIIYRGALLHTDIAMSGPAMEPLRAVAGPQRLRVDVNDGRAIALGDAAVHWDIARMLLAFARPGSSGES